MRACRLISCLVSVCLAACGAARPASVEAEAHSTPRTLWVVAPHPDDEILMAAGALAEAVRAGTPHEVVIVTNGDFTCARNGWARQEESIDALASIGVTEAHVHFLGYPDGWLANLGRAPLPPLARAARDGACGEGDTTYGARGAEHMDVHSARTGEPAPYTSEALVADLSALFDDAPPGEIHLPHALDAHPDHAMTYAFVRRALHRAHRSALLVRHVVHVGPCWPAAGDDGACVDPSPTLDATPLPPLPPPLTAYGPDRVEAADGPARRAAIAHYVTQLEAPLDTSWLASFARTTEVAWLESVVGGEVPIEQAGFVDGEQWRAPVELSAELGEGALELGAGDRYVVRSASGRVELVRASASGEVILRSMEVPEAATRRIVLRVRPLREGFASIEVDGPDGFVLGAIDPAGITASTGYASHGARDVRLSALAPR